MSNAENDYGWGVEDDFIQVKQCDYCLAKYLHWTRTEKGWRLADDRGSIHNCKARLDKQSKKG